VEEEPVREQQQVQQKAQEPTQPAQTVTTTETAVTTSESDVALQQQPGKVEEVLEVIAEGDSVDIFYMVKPNDYHSKIAKNEYGRISMWKTIYKWNRKKIGNNPNLIYPFNEFLLKKPKENANPLEYDTYEYLVKQGESLWSIAGREYDNNYAWNVILRDNADVIGSDLNNLVPGTKLQLRTKIFN